MLDKNQAEVILDRLLKYAYSQQFLNKILRKSIFYKKGWFTLNVVMQSGNSFSIAISEDGTKFRNTTRLYRRNRIAKYHPKSEGLLTDLRGFKWF